LTKTDEVDDLAGHDDHDESNKDPGENGVSIVVVGVAGDCDIAERQKIELLVTGTTWTLVRLRLTRERGRIAYQLR
jgi:hypothetical protein